MDIETMIHVYPVEKTGVFIPTRLVGLKPPLTGLPIVSIIGTVQNNCP